MYEDYGYGVFSTIDERYLHTVTFEDGITKIPDYALYNATSVLYVTIPETVMEIGYGAFNGALGVTIY
jgi:hypothetical protein